MECDRLKNLDDNAQLLLIAGFAVGVGIVVLTIMLNNVIYASNIASESSIDTSRYEITNAIQMTTEAYEDAYKTSMESGSFNNTVFERHLEAYDEMASRNFAISGFTFDIHNNTIYDPYYTQNGLQDGRENWTIISNINTTDTFIIEVNESTLGDSANSLVITATNTSGVLWSIELYNSSGTVLANVSDKTSTVIYSVSGTSYLNITGDVGNFQFQPNTDGGDYSINVIGGANSMGRFTLRGQLENEEDYRFARYWIANPTISMSSYEMKVIRTLPISLPGRAA